MELSKETKSEIFDIVNLHHLKLKGEAKRSTKRCFTATWKPDNNCFKMMMALYHSHDYWEKSNESEKVQEAFEYEFNTEPVKWKKFIRYIRFAQEENDELEKKLDDIEKGKGYMKIEKHEELLKETKDYFRNENLSMQDKMIKAKNEAQFYQDKLEYAERRHATVVAEKDKYIALLQIDNAKDMPLKS